MTADQLTRRGIEEFVGGSYQRATALLLLALCAERETAPAEAFDAIRSSDFAVKES